MFGPLIPLIALCVAADPGTPVYDAVAVAPVDEASQDPGFETFRKDLVRIVRDRDAQGLLKHVDEDIKCSFGGEAGIVDFAAMWNLRDAPDESAIWAELGQVLDLGGAFTEDPRDITALFIAPYVFTAFPDSLDAFEYAVVTGQGVRVRSEPGLSASIVTTVSYLAVKPAPEAEPVEETIDGETWPWQKVVLPDGRTGYIWGKYVRSPIGYRAGFSKKSGAWKMVFFLAGD